jgi:hypothetical protein
MKEEKGKKVWEGGGRGIYSWVGKAFLLLTKVNGWGFIEGDQQLSPPHHFDNARAVALTTQVWYLKS